VNPAYEFDNLSEKQVHVGSGKCKNRSGDGFPVAAPRPATQTAWRCAWYGQVPTLHRFFVLPAEGAHAVR